MTSYDAVIVGGGPAGLSAALTLGRARKRVLLCDSGPRRNAAATHIHNFITQDGTPPDAFRAVAREQLAAYPSVEVRDVRVKTIAGTRGAFHVELPSGSVEARRIILSTGMVDTMLPIDGFSDLWGRAIFQCPYCHGWEVQDQRWAYLVLPSTAAHLMPFALMLRGWTHDLVVFTAGAVEVSDQVRRALENAQIRLETAPISRLVRQGERLEAVALANGTVVPRDVLFTQPPQLQVELIQTLGLVLDDEGYVKVDR